MYRYPDDYRVLPVTFLRSRYPLLRVVGNWGRWGGKGGDSGLTPVYVGLKKHGQRQGRQKSPGGVEVTVPSSDKDLSGTPFPVLSGR